MCVFLFKQKTAYEMRISDWSSDVCSSDLLVRLESDKFVARHRRRGGKDVEAEGDERNLVAARRRGVRLIKADEIELVEDAARGRQLLGNLVLHRFQPGVETAIPTREHVVERREGNRHLFRSEAQPSEI